MAEDLRARLNRAGFALTEHRLSSDMIRELRGEARYLRSVRDLWSSGSGIPNVHLPLDQLPCWTGFRSFLKVVGSKAVRQVALELFPAGLALYGCDLFSKLPGSGTVPWHRDREFWRDAPEQALTFWIPLCDVTDVNGAITYAFPAQRNAATVVEALAGQIVVHNVDALHSSGPNGSAQNRDAIAIRVAPAGLS